MLYIGLHVFLVVVMACSVFLGRTEDSIIALFCNATIAILVVLRELTLSDDQEYLRIYTEINTDFFGSPSKYGFGYKLFIWLVDLTGVGSVNIAFACIFLSLALVVFFSGVKYRTLLFAVVFFALQIPLLIQMRQGLSLVFILAAVLAIRKGRSPYIYLIFSCLAHFAVIPFLFALFLANKVKDVSTIKSICFSLLILSCPLVFFDFTPLFNEFFLNNLILSYYVSQEAMLEGNVGVGGFILYILLVGSSVRVYFLNSTNKLATQTLLLSFFGLFFYSLTISLPLLQRFILPFYVVMIVNLFSDNRKTYKYQILIVISSLILSLSREKTFSSLTMSLL
jgi:hypothetical protein